MLRFRGAVTIICCLAGIFALVIYWPAQRGRWRRAFAVTGAAFVCLLAVLARVNIYELMFHPDAAPSFARGSQAKLDRDEKVIAIKVGPNARAYPIRNVSYHHVINDVLDHVGIVATY